MFHNVYIIPCTTAAPRLCTCSSNCPFPPQRFPWIGCPRELSPNILENHLVQSQSSIHLSRVHCILALCIMTFKVAPCFSNRSLKLFSWIQQMPKVSNHKAHEIYTLDLSLKQNYSSIKVDIMESSCNQHWLNEGIQNHKLVSRMTRPRLCRGKINERFKVLANDADVSLHAHNHYLWILKSDKDSVNNLCFVP